MKQATGSNTPQSGNKVSIQLSLDGHSFSVPALPELPAGEAPVTVELLLPRTMLVPGELFDAEWGAEMLAACIFQSPIRRINPSYVSTRSISVSATDFMLRSLFGISRKFDTARTIHASGSSQCRP